jgi:hypothetical protein
MIRRMRGTIRNTARLLGALVVLSGCSFNYGESRLADSFEDALPEARIRGLSHAIADGDRPVMLIRAELLETYTTLKKHVLRGLFFEEYDQQGARAASGSAELVVYHFERETAELSGKVEIRSEREKGQLSGTDFAWDRKAWSVASAAQSEVIVRKDDGSELRGRGFEADLRRQEIRFLGPVRGTYVAGSRD